MIWIVAAVLLVAVLVGLFFACAVSTPRRPASDATYTTNAYIAAGAVTGSALLAVAGVILVATA
ncbi:hypothetical protein [Tsukamurella sp. PLM1]|uniref:hypothetical protein n=1 Tax=Tsukamurella sp. PLM1 TaxID=2929795 RepID=UPI002067B3DE|nr:hypothetical protein [Tsukamurella sp. PLM1]BDH56056.1 hypothetical protein MTP03_09950 [Tsukamurella sp. PLM1]